jgi:hypothetical protein
MNEFICLIETDSKFIEAVKSATQSLCIDFNLNFVQKNSLSELDQFIASKDKKITLLILSSEALNLITAETLAAVLKKYASSLVLTTFEDPLKPLKKIETWPIENIIYKPFDTAILQEHLRFALIKNEKIQTTVVHSSAEKNWLEKICREYFLQLSEFGFTIESDTEYDINMAYKFYHLNFLDQKKTSLWAKPVSKTDRLYEFIFCAPTTTAISSLRQKAAESKNKLLTAKWHGFETNKSVINPKIYIQAHSIDDIERITDYLKRKFASAQIFQIPQGQIKEKLDCDLLISENEFTAEQLKALFKKNPLYFRITTEHFIDRESAEKILLSETVRLPKPLDKNYLGHLINTYFPSCVESEPNIKHWFPSINPALHSEMIEVSELSEAAFTYENKIQFNRGDVQEFALTQEDENELRPIKVKIQFVDTQPTEDKQYLHQAVFYGIRDAVLKKLRLWMLQTHINQKKIES